MPGNGKLRITGGLNRSTRESIQTAFDYLKGSKSQLGVEKDIDSFDFHVQVVDLLTSGRESKAGVAFFVALLSLLKEQPVRAGLVVLGKMTIHGNIQSVQSLSDRFRSSWTMAAAVFFFRPATSGICLRYQAIS